MKLLTFSSMMLLTVSAETCANPDAIVQSAAVYADNQCATPSTEATEGEIEKERNAFNAKIAPHINKCGAIKDPSGTLTVGYGKVTCPDDTGTVAKTYTDAACTAPCELPACKDMEATYTYTFGTCTKWFNGAIVKMWNTEDGAASGAAMMAASISASLVAVASTLF